MKNLPPESWFNPQSLLSPGPLPGNLYGGVLGSIIGSTIVLIYAVGRGAEDRPEVGGLEGMVWLDITNVVRMSLGGFK